jgi:hypothetical protein
MLPGALDVAAPSARVVPAVSPSYIILEHIKGVFEGVGVIVKVGVLVGDGPVVLVYVGELCTPVSEYLPVEQYFATASLTYPPSSSA